MLRPVPHQVDTAGTVWIARDVVYRRISPDHQEATLKLLNSMLLKELVSKCLFPATRVNPDSLARGELVLEHDRAPFILCPWEWSFSMLKDANLTLLSVSDICEKYGYYLQDAHMYNVVFFSSHPMFVDFGSLREKGTGWKLPLGEFFRYCYLPLKLWSEGNFYVANCLLRDLPFARRLQPFAHVDLMPLFRKYRKPFLKRNRVAYWLTQVANMVMWQIPALRMRLFDVSRLEKLHYSLSELRERIESLQAPPHRTEWGKYHDENFRTGDVSPRFSRILKILGQYRWETAVDVAGNRGYFTGLVARKFPGARLLCLDYDSHAIDRQFSDIRKDPELAERITVGIANIMYPQCMLLPLEDRIRADLVLALALTHHLLLRQNADMDVLLGTFGAITRRYLAIEFMPLGLWDGTKTKPVPAWYTKEWFKARLETGYRVLLEEQLEPNRIFFFCEKIEPLLAGNGKNNTSRSERVVASDS